MKNNGVDLFPCRFFFEELSMAISPSSSTPHQPPNHLKPGDEAEPGTPGSGEDICGDCSGTGKRKDGSECPTCEGTGRIIQGIGGG
ncbi:MAG TPA: hypothetical protein VJ654_19500 [Noviherbaspirillum sp.]|nr:hypothetical protein [Noviherbaspirillum sp.]